MEIKIVEKRMFYIRSLLKSLAIHLLRQALSQTVTSSHVFNKCPVWERVLLQRFHRYEKNDKVKIKWESIKPEKIERNNTCTRNISERDSIQTISLRDSHLLVKIQQSILS